MYAWEFQSLQNIAKQHGWVQFVSMQNFYNLLYREEEREMIPYCRDVGVGLIPVGFSPLSPPLLPSPLPPSQSPKTTHLLHTPSGPLSPGASSPAPGTPAPPSAKTTTPS